MNGSNRDVLARALICEGVSLAGLVIAVWLMTGGHRKLARYAEAARAQLDRRPRVSELDVAAFGAEVSAWDHRHDVVRGTG